METPALDRPMIDRLVQKLSGSRRAVVSNWAITLISSGGGEAAGIYRVSGNEEDGDVAFPWTMILKILPAEAGAKEPSAWNYSRRETLAYSSGFLDGTGAGLAAPRCLEIDTSADGTTWLDRYRHVGNLESLPQTLCHLDAYRGNLFPRREAAGLEQTIAIDWAFVESLPSVRNLLRRLPRAWRRGT